ncbi:MAG: hypothetical protein WCP32_16510 [Bacteroidota bacterium]
MKKFYALVILICITFTAIGQVSINNDNSGPDPSAMLDVKSTDRGFLPPRMTTGQMNSIVTPLEGLLVYNTSVNSLYWFNGTTWKRFNEFNYTETDPIFSAHPANGITTLEIGNWNTAYSNRITVASGTAPLSLSIAGNLLTGSITAANSSTNGYLTSTDWNTFNAKQNALTLGNVISSDMSISGGNNAVIGSGLNLTITKGSLISADLTITGGSNAVLGSGAALTVNKGNLTEATSSVLTITGGTNAALGTGTTIQVKQATTSQSGYLTSTDWNTFNNKQSALAFGNLTSSDITVTGGSSAVKGTGATLAINKGNLTETGSSVLTITGGSNSVLGAGSTIQVKQATTNQSGYLSTADFNSFKNKVSSQWTANGAKLHYNTGNVGVGTSNPQSKIDIAGNAVIGSTYSGNNAAPANGLLVEGKAGFGTVTPAASAALEVTSTNSGVLLPRMTRAQRNAIATPAEGLMVYCLNCGTSGALSIFTSGAWLTFSPCATLAPAAGTHLMSQGQVVWNWLPVSGAAGYKWNTVADYETATDMGTALTKTETGTVCDTTYTRYIWAYSNCGESAMTTLSATVPATPPDAPTDGVNTATQTSIVWNWNASAGATGYKWNTTNNYSTAIDMGTDTTKTETGDTCGTAYTRFVWAYNGCGYSPVDTLTQSTLPCWACGISTMTINHVAGAVAPVTKTTTYGTVTNIPGELTKCWITKNLGATQQATAVSDATEASAGWYWQFNRKQGYKNDGSTTPAWTITSINESSDWLTANDPCNLELGTQWRIPTYTEWYNVDNTGGWTTWAGPWGSGLKLHAAGYLSYSGGSLDYRGTDGIYWSSTQGSAALGWYLNVGSSYSYMGYDGKAYGFSLRCLRDN